MENEMPKRHGCLTAYLVFMMIVNTLTALVYFFNADKIVAAYPSMPSGTVYVLGVGCLINGVIAFNLFWWRKWAFYAFCVIAVVVLFINILIGVGAVGSIGGLLGPVILYAVLQIGGENKGWKNLK